MDLSSGAAQEAFEQVVIDVIEPVRRFLARRTDPDTADDVLSEVLLVLWRRLDAVPPDPLPWAYGIARNCLANAERSRRRQLRLAARIAVVDPPSEASAIDPSPDERVQSALSALRGSDVELLRLWSWEGLGPSEIGAVLDISANAASIRLHRARERFKDELRKHAAGAGHEGPNEGRAQ